MTSSSGTKPGRQSRREVVGVGRILRVAARAARRDTWPILPIFSVMQEIGSVPDVEMYRTFNMGVGMVVICSAADAEAVRYHFDSPGACYPIGRVVAGARDVKLQ